MTESQVKSILPGNSLCPRHSYSFELRISMAVQCEALSPDLCLQQASQKAGILQRRDSHEEAVP